LGIGTAIKAIQRLSEFIIEGSRNILFPGSSNFTTAMSLWKHISREAAHLQKDEHQTFIGTKWVACHKRRNLRTSVTRMGFSEHGYCVTAATQCLASADAARRNLLTLTHELLHSHVKGLFATILAGIAESDLDDAQLIALVRDYKTIGRQAKSNALVQRGWTVLR